MTNAMYRLMSVLVVSAFSTASTAAMMDAAPDASDLKLSGRVVVKLNADEADGSEARAFAVNMDTQGSEIEAGGPWIGVQFGPVPAPLASHLQLEPGTGQLVLNVMKDSPADAAGLQQYDVIEGIGSAPVPAKMAEFLEQVRALQPNERVALSIIRGGAPTDAMLTVGTRPTDWKSYEYKYENVVEDLAQGGVFRRGGIIRKGPDGEWSFNAIGDDDSSIWRDLPKLGGEHFNALLRPVPFGMQRNVTVQSINGKEVRIERSEDGTITVTKTERNGEDAETSTATYADEDAFAAADPDTYESYKNNFPSTFKFDNGYSMMFAPHLDGRQLRLKLNGGDVDFDFAIKGIEDLEEHIEALMDHVPGDWDDEALSDEISDRIEDALKRGKEMGRRLKVFTRQSGGGDGAHEKTVVVRKQAARSIAINADGTVTVTTRDDRDEVIEQFESVDALRSSRPDLYERYQHILGAGDDAATPGS